MKRFTWWIVGVLGVFAVLCCGPGPEPMGTLAFGWLIFPFSTVPKMTVEPVALAVGCGSFMLLIAITHGLAGWLYTHAHREQTPRPVWRLRWTLAIAPIVVLLFATSICLIVVVHQIVWLATTNERIYTYHHRRGWQRWQSEFNLTDQYRAATMYEQEHHKFPPGGTFDQYGNPLHSWETMLLPYIDNSALPEMSLPWNGPRNAEHFKVELSDFLNPGVNSSRSDSNNFGLSHYAANARVLGADRAMRTEEITDGLSHTIMAGEVKENFRPWGDPVNWRDPAQGVQKSPDGFGGPWADGSTQFLMMDGSVRSINKDIDPSLLKALATPRGGEPVPENFDH